MITLHAVAANGAIMLWQTKQGHLDLITKETVSQYYGLQNKGIIPPIQPRDKGIS